MAGSYKHIVNDDGSFAGYDAEGEPQRLDMLDNLGDAWEALEECYDMIQYLSGGDRQRIAEASVYGHLRPARARYGQGLTDDEAARFIDGYWRE